ncbi:MAG: aldo/keto reductase [archaeon]
MQYRRLGRTNIDVSVIGFGGGPLQVVSKPDSISLVHHAIRKGINIIDVDKVDPEKEEKVGDALSLARGRMHIAAKSFSADEESMKKDVSDSLKKLKTPVIDIYQMHLVRNEDDLEKRCRGALKALVEARKKGQIRFIGITGHHIPTMLKALRTNHFDTMLVPYNIGHTLSAELIREANERDIGIMAMKTLGGGFLVDPKFDGEMPAKQARQMTVENALRFVLANKGISCAPVGFLKIKQIDEAAEIADKEFGATEEELNSMHRAVLDFLGDDYCRCCKYCLPCAHEDSLEIDEILRIKGYYEKYGYKRTATTNYSRKAINALACESCGACEARCPYHIPIARQLKEAHEILLDPQIRDPHLISEKTDCRFDREWNDMLSGFQLAGEHDKVVSFCREHLKGYPNNIILLTQISGSLTELDRSREAYPYLMKAHGIKPDMPGLKINIGRYYLRERDFDTALGYLDGNLHVLPDDISAYHTWVYKAICYKAKGAGTKFHHSLDKIRSFARRFKGESHHEVRQFLEDEKLM